MPAPIPLTFSNTRTSQAVEAEHPADLPQALQHLHLSTPRPVLVLIGGAGKMAAADRRSLRSLFVKVLVPLAETLQAVVIDGGTDCGIMRLMGRSRHKLHATFPLLGIAPRGRVAYPGEPLPDDQAAYLEAHHTHFLVIPGNTWGDESTWISQAAGAIAQHHPSVTILINGGEVTWRDAQETVSAGRPIIAIAGSGRAADELSTALAGKVTNERARRIVSSGLLQAIDLRSSDELTQVVEHILTTGTPAQALAHPL